MPSAAGITVSIGTDGVGPAGIGAVLSGAAVWAGAAQGAGMVGVSARVLAVALPPLSVHARVRLASVRALVPVARAVRMQALVPLARLEIRRGGEVAVAIAVVIEGQRFTAPAGNERAGAVTRSHLA